jgi:hypothetical protein
VANPGIETASATFSVEPFLVPVNPQDLRVRKPSPAQVAARQRRAAAAIQHHRRIALAAELYRVCGNDDATVLLETTRALNAIRDE